MVLGRIVLMGGVRRQRMGKAELGLFSASMATRNKAKTDGKIVLVMEVVGSRNAAWNLDLAWAGVKTGPYVRRAARCAGCRAGR